MPNSSPRSRLVAAALSLALIAGLLGAVTTAPAYAAGPGGAPGTFVRLAPTTILDTKAGIGALRRPVPGRRTVTVTVRGKGGVPATGVGAVMINIAASDAKAAGPVTVYRTGRRMPKVTSLSLIPEQPVSAVTVTALGAGGAITLANRSARSTHLTVELLGWFRGGTGTDPGGLTPLAPRRVADTRSGEGFGAPVPLPGRPPGRPPEPILVDVGGRDGIPADAGGVLLSLTTLAPAADGGLSVNGVLDELAATPFPAGRNLTTLIDAQLLDGRFALYNRSLGHLDVAIDVLGYVAPGAAYREGTFRYVQASGAYRVPTDPYRIVPPGGSIPVVQSIVPPRASSVLTQVIVPEPTAPGRLRLRWSATGEQVAPDIAFVAGRTTSATVLLPMQSATGDAVEISHDAGQPVEVLAVPHAYVTGPDPSNTGLSWDFPTVVDPAHGAPTDLSCPSVDFCATVDQYGAAMVDDGDGWTLPRLLPGLSTLSTTSSFRSSVSCPQPGRCVAVAHGRTFRYAAGVWTELGAVTEPPIRELSCPTATRCFAVDDRGRLYWLDDTTWTAISGPLAGLFVPGFFADLECPTASRCFVAQFRGVWPSTGGDWGAPVDLGFVVYGMSCPTTTLCVAVGEGGHARSFDGTEWGPTIHTGLSVALDVSCTTQGSCVAVDSQGAAVSFDGTGIDPPTVIAPGSQLRTVSCATATSCRALSDPGEAYTWNGTTWSGAVRVDPRNLPTAVSCPSATFCLAVDAGGTAVTIRDGTASDPEPADPDGSLSAVSCATETFCLAVDDLGRAVEFGLGGWSPTQPVVPGVPLTGVSCPTTRFCVAVAEDGRASTFNGSQWSSPAVADPAGGLRTVSCASPTFCLATGDSARALVYDGADWSDHGAATGVDAMASVSCATTTFCLAVERDGNRGVVFDGGRWGAPTADGPRNPVSVSCPSTTSCLAVGSDYQSTVGRFADGRWSVGGFEPLFANARAVDCFDETICVAVNRYGEAMRGHR